MIKSRLIFVVSGRIFVINRKKIEISLDIRHQNVNFAEYLLAFRDHIEPGGEFWLPHTVRSVWFHMVVEMKLVKSFMNNSTQQRMSWPFVFNIFRGAFDATKDAGGHIFAWLMRDVTIYRGYPTERLQARNEAALVNLYSSLPLFPLRVDPLFLFSTKTNCCQPKVIGKWGQFSHVHAPWLLWQRRVSSTILTIVWILLEYGPLCSTTIQISFDYAFVNPSCIILMYHIQCGL